MTAAFFAREGPLDSHSVGSSKRPLTGLPRQWVATLLRQFKVGTRSAEWAAVGVKNLKTFDIFGR